MLYLYSPYDFLSLWPQPLTTVYPLQACSCSGNLIASEELGYIWAGCSIGKLSWWAIESITRIWYPEYVLVVGRCTDYSRANKEQGK